MQNKYIKDHVNEAVEFIENKININHTVEEISKSVHLSKFHLQRLFKSLTGKGLMSYSRSRKLTLSLEDLKTSSLSVAKIGQKYGYDYEQSFSRAFKAEFGVSPHEYRQKPITVNITPKADVTMLMELDNAVIIKPFHVYKPAFTLVGVLNKVRNEDNEKQFKSTHVAVDFFHNRRKDIKGSIDPNLYYGYTFWDDTCEASSFYLSALEVSDDSEVPESFIKKRIPSTHYTVFKMIGFFPAEAITWQHMVDIWHFMDDSLFANRSIEKTSLFHFECIDMNVCTPTYCELDLYVPVV